MLIVPLIIKTMKLCYECKKEYRKDHPARKLSMIQFIGVTDETYGMLKRIQFLSGMPMDEILEYAVKFYLKRKEKYFKNEY